jgi:D-alanine-D-alanine ligase
MSDRLRVAVLMGGPSAEHDVSLVSGGAVLRALDRERYAPVGVAIGRDGRWSFGPPDAPAASPETGARVVRAGASLSLPAGLERLSASADLAFIALHGPFGEDGTIQAILEALGMPYTGAGVAASALGMDKALFKRMVEALGIPVAPWIEVSRRRWGADPDGELARLEELAREAGDQRLMVKPAALGSSVGMTLAHHANERPAALAEAFAHGPRALVEVYIAEARELELAVLGRPDAQGAHDARDALDAGDVEVFGPGEIFPGREFYDYSAKYDEGVSRTTPAADVDDELRDRVRQLAVAAFRAIGAEAMARVDFLVHPGRVLLSEINTIPGFTPISLYPAMVEAGGISFGELCSRLIQLGLERAR